MHNIRGMNRSRRKLHSEFESLREDLSNLRQDLVSFGQALLRSGRSEIEGRGSKMRGGLQRSVESLTESVEGARQRGLDSLESVQQQVEERPFASLGIAFAIGLIVGKLLDWPMTSDE